MSFARRPPLKGAWRSLALPVVWPIILVSLTVLFLRGRGLCGRMLSGYRRFLVRFRLEVAYVLEAALIAFIALSCDQADDLVHACLPLLS